MATYREQIEQQLAPWRARYEALQPRERQLVAVGAILLSLALIYLVIWTPLAIARRHGQSELVATRDLAQRLETIGAALGPGQNSGASGPLVSPDASLLSAVDLASKNGTLNKPPSRLQPDGDNQVRVWIEDVQFDALTRWMNELQTRYGVRIDTLDIERQPTPGLVNARLALVRAS